MVLRQSVMPSGSFAPRPSSAAWPPIAGRAHPRNSDILLEIMRLPTNIFFAMLLGVLAFLFGFGIAVLIIGALPDVLADFGEAGRSFSLIAPVVVAHHKAGVQFLDRLGRRGAASHLYYWPDVRRARPQLNSLAGVCCGHADYLERNYNRI